MDENKKDQEATLFSLAAELGLLDLSDRLSGMISNRPDGPPPPVGSNEKPFSQMT